jgi:hypothetical protein
MIERRIGLDPAYRGPERRRRGRPALKPGAGAAPYIHVCVCEDTYAAICRAAFRTHDGNLSAFVRDALLRVLAASARNSLSQ